MSQQTLLWCVWAAILGGVVAWSLVLPASVDRLSSVRRGPWAESLPPWLRPRPDAWPARQRWLIGAAAGLAVVVWGWDFGPPIIVAGALVVPIAAIGLGRLERGGSRQAETRLRRQAPGGLEAMAACLDAGLPLRQATEVVASLSPPDLAARLHVVVGGIGVGLTDSEAWLGLAADPILGAMARDVSRAADWGTTVSSLLVDASTDLRRQAEAESKTKARAVGVRTVLPLTLCYLPAFIFLGIVPILAGGVLSVFGR